MLQYCHLNIDPFYYPTMIVVLMKIESKQPIDKFKVMSIKTIDYFRVKHKLVKANV
jgi:hypothetical protein